MALTEIDLYLDASDLNRQLRAEAMSGLTARPKWLSPRWFYDARGSELFEEITRLPEYYPTRAEREILAAYAPEIAEASGAKTLVELGSGSSEKTRLLLDAIKPDCFMPLDVSATALREAAAALATEYPAMKVHGLVADFTRHLNRLPRGGQRLVAFLGGTIGNLIPAEREEFLSGLRSALDPGEWLLLGTDLVKDPEVLVRAYDDAQGVTAEFNRNVLHRLNAELAADFEPEAFSHVAHWDADQEWIEMRLRASRPMTVHLRRLDMTVEFAAGEQLHTEVSAKFRQAGIAAELRHAGFTPVRWWTDTGHRFGLTLAVAA
ncbi:L-histidine N(alpha)-methyltransferase [Longispora albida]|uniref:L-histidine N(alpha)-methyltransferase n=1 Tax=Longispora albida TaxID=203523 RepID=UPI000365FB3C|nr:L-histidine N(alpha)-methyltransferase [Longispora albida]